MKKILLSVLGLVAFGPLLLAQSLTSNSFIRPAAFVDTFYYAGVSSVSPATQGLAQTWDYSNLVPNGNIATQQFFSAGDSLVYYPGTLQYRLRDLYSPTGQAIPSAEFTSVNSSGYTFSATYVSGLTESLTAFTGGANDQLEIPQQRVIYTDTLFYLKFPVGSQSSWSSQYNHRVNYNATVASAGLSGTPGVFQTTFSQTRSVVGTGQIIIPDENGNAMPPVDAFMIEVTESNVDSVFLGGAPAPAPLLGLFGLSQGSTVTSKSVLFYPINNCEGPLASYSVDEVNGSILGFIYRPRTARKANSIGLAQMDLISTNVYPNPMLQGGSLNIDLSVTADLAAIKIYNIQGQQVAEYNTSEINTQNLSITPNLGEGIYLISLVNQSGVELSRTKLQVL
tara:strand:+ start:18511 stop:19695 length:1185 start_codon:yes stop_codon:yes gene_type:complete